MELANNINTVLSIISNICILIITIYTTTITFWYKSVNFLEYSYSTDVFFGSKATIQIRNESLSSISIKKVYLLFSNGTAYEFKKFEIPLLVGARQSLQLEMDPVANHISELSAISNIDRTLFVEMADSTSVSVLKRRGLFYSTSQWIKNFDTYRKIKQLMSPIPSKYYRLVPYRLIRHNDTFLSDGVKYILLYSFNSVEQTIYITDKGFMSGALFNGDCWVNDIGEGEYSVINDRLKKIFSNYTKDVEYKLFCTKKIAGITSNIPTDIIV